MHMCQLVSLAFVLLIKITSRKVFCFNKSETKKLWEMLLQCELIDQVNWSLCQRHVFTPSLMRKTHYVKQRPWYSHDCISYPEVEIPFL